MLAERRRRQEKVWALTREIADLFVEGLAADPEALHAFQTALDSFSNLKRDE